MSESDSDTPITYWDFSVLTEEYALILKRVEDDGPDKVERLLKTFLEEGYNQRALIACEEYRRFQKLKPKEAVKPLQELNEFRRILQGWMKRFDQNQIEADSFPMDQVPGAAMFMHYPDKYKIWNLIWKKSEEDKRAENENDDAPGPSRKRPRFDKFKWIAKKNTERKRLCSFAIEWNMSLDTYEVHVRNKTDNFEIPKPIKIEISTNGKIKINTVDIDHDEAEENQEENDE